MPAKQFDFLGSLTGDKANTVVFDNSKLKAAVPEFVTKVPFHKGVRIALDYILNHPECRAEDPDFDKWCDRVIAGVEKLKKEFTSSSD